MNERRIGSVPVSVLGGGPSGVAIAFALSGTNIPVNLFALGAPLGGRCRSIRKWGFEFPVWPDAIGSPSPGAWQDPGQVAARAHRQGACLMRDERIVAIHHDGSRIQELEIEGIMGSHRRRVRDVVSTLPLDRLAQLLSPGDPSPIADAVARIRYEQVLVRHAFAWIKGRGAAEGLGNALEKQGIPSRVYPARGGGGIAHMFESAIGSQEFPGWAHDDVVSILDGAGVATDGIRIETVTHQLPEAAIAKDEKAEAAAKALHGYLEGFSNLSLCGPLATYSPMSGPEEIESALDWTMASYGVSAETKMAIG